ncbi:MAG: alpha/beta hydrolase [Quisquiliibacterium sp.]
MQRLTIAGRGGHVAALNFGPTHGPIDIVFLHATGFCALTYRRLLEPLDPSLRVVALDLRGHGHTTLPAQAAKLVHWYGYADDVAHALQAINRTSPSTRLIAGHSLGGTVALLAATRHPGLAHSLLMIDPAMVLPWMRRWLLMPFGPRLLQGRLPIARSAARRRSSFAQLNEVRASYEGRGAFRSWLPGFLEDYLEDAFMRKPDGSVALRCDPAWEAATFCAHRHDLRSALRALQLPARMLVAEQHSTAARVVPILSRLAPSLEVERLPGSTHFIPMEQPELVRARMLGLLKASTR